MTNNLIEAEEPLRHFSSRKKKIVESFQTIVKPHLIIFIFFSF